MKIRTTFGSLAIALLLVGGDNAPANGGASDWGDFGLRSRHYDFSEPFDPKRLRALAEGDLRGQDEEIELASLLLHAAVVKDDRFQDLVVKEGIGHVKKLRLALSAYDYMLNGNEAALDHILAAVATDDIGRDVWSIAALSVLDEWDRSIRAFRKHFVHTDGSGTFAYTGFLAKRRYFYPTKYEEMEKVITAPIAWGRPLLPKERRQ